jgi:hypothetical protein
MFTGLQLVVHINLILPFLIIRLSSGITLRILSMLQLKFLQTRAILNQSHLNSQSIYKNHLIMDFIMLISTLLI